MSFDKTRRWGLLLLMGLFGLSGCARLPIQTKAYTWSGTHHKKDWFALSTHKAQRAFQKRVLGRCADPRLRGSLLRLKQMTKECLKASHNVYQQAQLARAGYWVFLSVGIIGGGVVLAGPVIQALSEQPSTHMTLALSVGGASLTALSALAIQAFDLGARSNQQFHRAQQLGKLLQQLELHWEQKVCQAPTIALGLQRAAKLLGHVSGQCLVTRPDVSVNPNVASALQRQETNVSHILERSRQIQEHDELRLGYSQSRQLLASLKRSIHVTSTQMMEQGEPKSHLLRQKLRLLCAQADAEFLRYSSLHQRFYHKSTDTPAPQKGAWGGICKLANRPLQSAKQQTVPTPTKPTSLAGVPSQSKNTP